jgi:hypothetical protein
MISNHEQSRTVTNNVKGTLVDDFGIKRGSWVLFLGVLLILISFTGVSVAQVPVEIHPQESKMPHADFVATTLKRQFRPDMARLYPKHHAALYSYRSKSVSTEIDLLLESKWNVYVVSLSRDRFLVLDRSGMQLVEFNVTKGTKQVIAVRGQGATDLFFPRSMMIEGETVFVPMGGYRITAFDCSVEPCTLGYTVPLDKVNAGSMDRLGGQFLIFRQATGLSNDHPDIETVGAYSASVVDRDGKVVQSFGEGYDYGVHWMLLDAFQKGFIARIPGSDHSVIAYESFPFVYVFDKEHQLKSKLRLPGFTVGERRYEPDTGALHISYNKMSLISQMVRLDQDRVLVEIFSRGIEGVAAKLERSSYHILDPVRTQLHHMGDMTGSTGRLLFTDHGVLFVSEESVRWIPFD